MTDCSHRSTFLVPAAFVIVVFSGCGTEDINPDHVVKALTEPSPDTGGLVIMFPPSEDTYQQQQASAATNLNPTPYHVFLDDQLLAIDDGRGGLDAIVLSRGAASGIGYVPVGAHHVRIQPADGPAIFEGDGTVAAGDTTELFLHGPLTGLQGRFVVVPDDAPPGQEHVTVANLMGSGQTIEVVSCASGTACAAISPALALGDVFDADLPDSSAANHAQSLSDDGTGVGYRLVPSASLPNPPVLPLHVWSFGTRRSPPPAVFLTAPVYMSEQGQPQIVF